MLGVGYVDPTDFHRSALLVGLKEEQTTGFNPIKLGVIGSTDTHVSSAGNVKESSWVGAVVGEGTSLERLEKGILTSGIDGNPGGLAGVWAEENTRDSIFDALLRKEVFGTSGPRIRPRFFAGWDIEENLCAAPDMIERAYDSGVPMGGDIKSSGGGKNLTFLMQASKDPDGLGIETLQLIKGWIDSAGAMRTSVIPVISEKKGANTKIINTIKSKNIQKEIYLTDTVSLLKKSFSLEVEDNGELQGVNNRVQLSKCEETIQTLIKEKHMIGGVTFINPASCTISEESIIGLDVIIEANTHIRGNSKISNNCKIGPNSFIKDTIIHDNCEIINSTIFNSKIMDHVKIGPYSHIRPNCEISSHGKIGNFVEIKNSKLDEEVKVNHLSYIGDSKVGKYTNIGAGTITANFDGTKKYQTIIGKNSSIGANTVLIAPINLGDSVTTGAGSVITKDSQNNSLAIARSKQVNIKNWKKNKS